MANTVAARKKLEEKYEKMGLSDYHIKNLDQLKAIHNIDVNEIPGYQSLTAEHKELFDKTIIRFFNAWGLDRRNTLKVKCVHFVQEINFERQIDGVWEDIGQEVYALKSDNNGKFKLDRRLHKYVFEKGVSFKDCDKHKKTYLRFELVRDNWYHINNDYSWY